MGGGAWFAAIHEVAKSRTRLSDFTFIFHFHALEKEMATHSSILAWRMPGTEEPGGLLSTGLHRVGHNWSDLAVAKLQEQPKVPVTLFSFQHSFPIGTFSHKTLTDTFVETLCTVLNFIFYLYGHF